MTTHTSQFISHITTVDGGNDYMLDLVHLRNGQVIGITDDCAVVYPNRSSVELTLRGDPSVDVNNFPRIDLAQFVNSDILEILKHIPDGDRLGTFVMQVTQEYTVDLITLDDGKVLGIDGATLCLYENERKVFSGDHDAVIECVDLKIEVPA